MVQAADDPRLTVALFTPAWDLYDTCQVYASRYFYLLTGPKFQTVRQPSHRKKVVWMHARLHQYQEARGRKPILQMAPHNLHPHS